MIVHRTGDDTNYMYEEINKKILIILRSGETIVQYIIINKIPKDIITYGMLTRDK